MSLITNTNINIFRQVDTFKSAKEWLALLVWSGGEMYKKYLSTLMVIICIEGQNQCSKQFSDSLINREEKEVDKLELVDLKLLQVLFIK